MGIMRRNSNGYSSVGTVFTGSGTKDKHSVSYCENCLKIGVNSPLKHRIYLDESGKVNPNPPPDTKNWKQCWTCGDIVGVYAAKEEADIMTLTEPGDNPFKFGNSTVKSGESRKFDRTGKTQRKRQFKQDLSQYKEEDIKEALRKGSKLVNYVERQD